MEDANHLLIGKIVLDAKGVIIGRILEALKDDISGEITSVLIEPSDGMNLQNYSVTDRGQIVFPFRRLSRVKDVIIVEEPLA
jgi:sporulation protein YlmC with PRC-barrel domain